MTQAKKMAHEGVKSKPHKLAMALMVKQFLNQLIKFCYIYNQQDRIMAKSGTTPGAPKGNQNAVKTKIWSDAIRKAIIQDDNLANLAKALISKALDGDISALKEIGDRLEGKSIQSIEQSTEVSGDMRVYGWKATTGEVV